MAAASGTIALAGSPFREPRFAQELKRLEVRSLGAARLKVTDGEIRVPTIESRSPLLIRLSCAIGRCAPKDADGRSLLTQAFSSVPASEQSGSSGRLV